VEALGRPYDNPFDGLKPGISTPGATGSGGLDEYGEPPFRIEELDLEKRMAKTFPRAASGKRQFDRPRLLEPEVELGRGRTGERLVRPVESVVAKGKFETSLELALDERRKHPHGHEPFEASPGSFDESDGAGLSDGAESPDDTEVFEFRAESLGYELSSLIGDEMEGSTMPVNGTAQELDQVLGSGFLGKDTSGDGKSREGIEDESELEVEETEEARDVGEIDEKDVVREPGAESVVFGSVTAVFGWSSRRFFPEDPGDGPRGEPCTGASECEGDGVVTSESGEAHGADELADDVGEPPDGRLRANGGWPRVLSSSGFALPAADRAGGYTEQCRSVIVAPGEKLLRRRMR
jgi:hypothetical protein